MKMQVGLNSTFGIKYAFETKCHHFIHTNLGCNVIVFMFGLLLFHLILNVINLMFSWFYYISLKIRRD